MIAAAEEGYLGEGPTKATVPGYKIAVKSGTSQVSRPIIGENGKVSPCDQNCNTARGIYDHTFVGYNTGNSRYIVYLKLAEPRPGVVDNFASSTLSTHFSELMKSTLNYLNIPKEIN
jgi:cell division protein FtsI/penicillin-binding protein 2